MAGGRVVGLGKVEWVPFAPTELPRDQSLDDARSTVFDTSALTEDMEILGAPSLRVRVAATKANAKLAIRLCEVDPQGRSWLVTYGVLNLTHRNGHEQPEPLEPGRYYDVVVPLNFTAHRFKAGCKVRAAISEGLWPLVWPSPDVVDLDIDTAGTRLDLSRRRPPAVEAAIPIALASPLPSDPKGWPVMTVSMAGETVRVVETWPDSPNEITEIGETTSGGRAERRSLFRSRATRTAAVGARPRPRGINGRAGMSRSRGCDHHRRPSRLPCRGALAGHPERRGRQGRPSMTQTIPRVLM